MKSIPKIQLFTIFLVFICAAVGLTCGTAPQPKRDSFLSSLIRFPNLNLYYALLYAVSMAMVIGLLQQVMYLRKTNPSERQNNDGLQFAYAFARTWRVLIAAILSICLVGR